MAVLGPFSLLHPHRICAYHHCLTYKMSRFTSFICFGLVIVYGLQFVQQLTKIFSDVVSSNRVYLVKVIGLFPLMNVVFSAGVVKAAVVVEDPPSDLKIPETDASGQSSQIVNTPIVLSEELEDLVGLGVGDVEDFLFGEPGVVGAVGDWAGVVVAVRPVEVHWICQ